MPIYQPIIIEIGRFKTNKANLIDFLKYKIDFPKIFETGFEPFLTSLLEFEAGNNLFLSSFEAVKIRIGWFLVL